MTLSESLPDGSQGAQRLFVALWPDAEVRARLSDIAGALRLSGGRRVPPANLHLTLAFLGNADAGRRACIEQALSAAGGRAFALAFGAVRFHRRRAMVWLEAREVPPALERLVADINRALANCAYAPAARAFRAHVTLARNVRGLGPAPAEVALAWEVRDFCLVHSRPGHQGSEYAVLRRWPLAA